MKLTKKSISIILSLIVVIQMYSQDFIKEQKQYPKVKQAFEEKEDSLISQLSKINVEKEKLEIFFRAFKQEMKLEVWVKNKSDNEFRLFKEYDFCTFSGVLGPKRKEGDLQIPEGVYQIVHFNPLSNFFLSLGINYPNESDKILSDREKPGSDIYIHGGCASIGCIAITDDKIKELYVLAVLSKSNEQNKIQVHIFPTILEGQKFANLKIMNLFNKQLREFWNNLEPIYSYFEKNKMIPKITIDTDGKYIIK